MTAAVVDFRQVPVYDRDEHDFYVDPPWCTELLLEPWFPYRLPFGRLFGSNAANLRSTGFRANSNRSGTTPAQDWANYPDALVAIVERLAGVVIENRDAAAAMAQHDGPDTLHYVDPPYVWATRNRGGGGHHPKWRGYTIELADEQHRELLAFLRGLRGMVVLSGYPNPIYEELLCDWRRVDRAAYADGARPRTECLWLNQRCAGALAVQPLPLKVCV